MVAEGVAVVVVVVVAVVALGMVDAGPVTDHEYLAWLCCP
jgi:hypothetical protein